MAHCSIYKEKGDSSDVGNKSKRCSQNCGMMPRALCPYPSTRIARQSFARGYNQSIRSLSGSFFRMMNSRCSCVLPTPIDHRAVMPRPSCGGSEDGEPRRTKPRRAELEQNDVVVIPRGLCGFPSTPSARLRFQSGTKPNVWAFKSNFARTVGSVCDCVVPDKCGRLCDFLQCRGVCGKPLCRDKTIEIGARYMGCGGGRDVSESPLCCEDNREKCEGSVWYDAREMCDCKVCCDGARKPCAKKVSWEDIKTTNVYNSTRSQCDCRAVGDSYTDGCDSPCNSSDTWSECQYVGSPGKLRSPPFRPYQDQNHSKSKISNKCHISPIPLYSGVTSSLGHRQTPFSGSLPRRLAENHLFRYECQGLVERISNTNTLSHRKLPSESSSCSSQMSPSQTPWFTAAHRGNISAPDVCLKDTLTFRSGRLSTPFSVITPLKNQRMNRFTPH